MAGRRAGTELGQRIRFITFFDALKDPISSIKHPSQGHLVSDLHLAAPDPAESGARGDHGNDHQAKVDKIICLEESFYDLPAVVLDRANAARMAVEHLIKLGHRRIAYLAIAD